MIFRVSVFRYRNGVISKSGHLSLKTKKACTPMVFD